MLTPEYLQGVPDAMVELFARAEADILADMARRINGFDMFIPAAQHQMQALEAMGELRGSIIKELSRLTGKSQKELAAIMRDAGMETLAADDAIYRQVGLTSSPAAASPAVQRVLAAGLKKTNGLFTNLTKTTANTATKQFERALDRAYMQISSGGIDPTTAVKNAIKALAKEGVGAVTYPGGRTDSLEVAVRRATITGVNQTCLQIQETRADELGVDLVETTAHAGARPEHAAWQGQVFSRSGKSRKYPHFVSSTGYGTGAGLGGWNCSHSFRPYVEGMPRAYSKELLDSYQARDYEYNGQKMTEYEALQQQREIERNLRRWKRENMAMKAAGLDTAESATKIAKWQSTQKDFIRQTGLKRQADREQIAGWGRSQAAEAKIAAQKAAAGVANTAPSAIIRKKGQSSYSGAFRFVDEQGYRDLRAAAGKATATERKAIWDHTSGYIQTGNSWRINAAMRAGNVSQLPEESQATITTLRNVIAKNQTGRDVLAVRYADADYVKAAFGFDPSAMPPKDVAQRIQAECVGGIVEERAFVSVSLDEAKNVFTSKPYRIELEIPGKKNIYVSSNFQESEAILADGTQYVVKSATEDHGTVVLRVRVL